ncbi:MAG: hypothetical protein ACR2FV_06405 [Ornithinimicrobium sp.]|jgi:hypothetical protein
MTEQTSAPAVTPTNKIAVSMTYVALGAARRSPLRLLRCAGRESW